MTVLDASALLAFLLGEPGQEVVLAHFHDCCISAVNLSEVLGRFERLGRDSGPILEQLQRSALQVIDYDTDGAQKTAKLSGQVQHLGLSLGDRACLALAYRLGATALTADKSWSNLKIGISIRQIR